MSGAPRSLTRSFLGTAGLDGRRNVVAAAATARLRSGEKSIALLKGDKKLSENCGIFVHLGTEKVCPRNLFLLPDTAGWAAIRHGTRSVAECPSVINTLFRPVTFQNITRLCMPVPRSKKSHKVRPMFTRSHADKMSPRESGTHWAPRWRTLHIEFDLNTSQTVTYTADNETRPRRSYLLAINTGK